MSDTKTLHKLRLAVEMLADDRDLRMTALELRAFLSCAIQPRITMAELAERLGILQSDVSRIVGQFSLDGVMVSDRHGQKMRRPGYGLLKAEPDIHDHRRKVCTLTPKGTRLADKLVEILR